MTIARPMQILVLILVIFPTNSFGNESRFHFYSESLYLGSASPLLTQGKMDYRFVSHRTGIEGYGGIAFTLTSLDSWISPLLGLRVSLPILPVHLFAETRLLTNSMTLEKRLGGFIYHEKNLYSFYKTFQFFSELYGEYVLTSLSKQILWQLTPRLGLRYFFTSSLTLDLYYLAKMQQSSIGPSPGLRLKGVLNTFSLSLSVHRLKLDNSFQWSPQLVFGGEF